MSKVYVDVKSLPPALQRPLAASGYCRKDIAIEAAPEFYFASAYGDGYRAFAVAVNLSTGEAVRKVGSWGGGNAFTQTTVDDNHSPQAIPLNGAAILVQEGGGKPISARIVVNPGNVALLLPATDPVSDRDRDILAIFGGIKGGYRKEYLARSKVTEDEIGSLVSRGMLSRNKAGAIAVTTAGKNARGDRRAF